MIDGSTMRLLAITIALMLTTFAARAEAPRAGPQPGDSYRIVRDSVSSTEGPNGSRSSSSDRDTLVERVIAVREGGLELEYDIPGATAEDRARIWQFPVRVLKPSHGPLKLLNGPELEGRIDLWLKAGGLTREACGHWYFTWTAFQIQCDPQSVVEGLEAFVLGPDDLHDGVPYQLRGARAPAPLVRTKGGPAGETFTVVLAVDPEVVRQAEAQAEVVVAEVTGKTLTLEAALGAHSTDQISGVITVTLETDAAGRVWRRTMVTTLEIRRADGDQETRTTTETLTRRLVPH